MKYKVHEAVSISTGDPLYGRLEYSFPAGTIKPKSEAEEEALRRLVDGGFAEEAPETKSEKAAVAEEEAK